MQPLSASAESQTLGRYRLERRLAAGGMGELYIGVMPGPGDFERRVAIKKILPHLARNEAFVNRFIDEARIVVQLQHGNIVPVFDMGVEAGEYYIAMEYLQGWDLKTALRRADEVQQPWPIELVLLVGVEVARGLAYAHRKTDPYGRELGIVHRDISPSNILLGRDGVVKVTDFGIAKAAGKLVESVSGMLQGKFAYMSPEQAAGFPLDRRSDVFSLGVVLWETITGLKLFEADSDTATLRKVRSGDVPAPSFVRAEVPPELDRVLERCLARAREDRYQSADELERDLTTLLVSLYPGTGPTDLASYLGSTLFPETHPTPAPKAQQSFDDLLLDGLGELNQAVDPEGPTWSSSQVARRVKEATATGALLQTGTFPGDETASVVLPLPDPVGGAASDSRPQRTMTPQRAMTPQAVAPLVRVNGGSQPAWASDLTPVRLSDGTPVGRRPGSVTDIRPPRSSGLLVAVTILSVLLVLAGGFAAYRALVPERGTVLEVGTRPGGAWVTVDGWAPLLRFTPRSGALDLERVPYGGQRARTLVVSWPGYPPVEKVIDLKRGGHLVLLDLKRPKRTRLEQAIDAAETELSPSVATPALPEGVFGPVSPAGTWPPLSWSRRAGELLAANPGETQPLAPMPRRIPRHPKPPRPPKPAPEAEPTGWFGARCVPYGVLKADGVVLNAKWGSGIFELPVGRHTLSCTNRAGTQWTRTVEIRQVSKARADTQSFTVEPPKTKEEE